MIMFMTNFNQTLLRQRQVSGIRLLAFKSICMRIKFGGNGLNNWRRLNYENKPNIK